MPEIETDEPEVPEAPTGGDILIEDELDTLAGGGSTITADTARREA